MSINFFTTANEKYYHFVLPYIYSVLNNVPDSFVEICVEDYSQFMFDYSEQLIKLSNLGYNRYLIRQTEEFKYKQFIENTKRFLITPKFPADVYYIGDIDIFILDKTVESFHKEQMENSNSCYSNIVRPKSKRLTGLHACNKDWYELTKYARRMATTDMGHDENALYDIALNSIDGTPDQTTAGMKRPVHGLHLSPNRTIDSNPGWNVSSYGDKMVYSTKLEPWEDVACLFDIKYLLLIKKIQEWKKRNG